MHDVTVKPEPNPATETAVVTKFYYYHDEERKRAAREALRRIGKDCRYQKSDISADAEIETIWNILTESRSR